MKATVFIYVLLCGMMFPCNTENDFTINQASQTAGSKVINQDIYMQFVKSIEEPYNSKPAYLKSLFQFSTDQQDRLFRHSFF